MSEGGEDVVDTRKNGSQLAIAETNLSRKNSRYRIFDSKVCVSYLYVLALE